VIHRLTEGNIPVTLLVLHGPGGDENDFPPVARPLMPGARILSPRVEGSPEEVAEWLASFPLEGQRLYALGYSTGSDLAATLLLTRPGMLAGAVLLRPTSIAAPDPLPELGGVPVLAVPGRHGSHAVAQLLARAGAAVDLAVQDADEGLTPQDFALAKRWFAQFL
jgi:predicted esterase